jgi:hypothetical protein
MKISLRSIKRVEEGLGLKQFWNWLQKKLEKLKKRVIKPRVGKHWTICCNAPAQVILIVFVKFRERGPMLKRNSDG